MVVRALHWLVQTARAGLIRSAGEPDLISPDELDCLAQYNTYDARSLFSHLLRRAESGEEIVIARAGDPVAKLVPYAGEEPRRKGMVRVQLVVNDAPPAEE